jgi:leucyl-tRNA synthetase
MAERYEPSSFEPKWRKRWEKADLFKTREEPGRPKFYGMDFFPYPSGAGLSVGHCRNYVPTDVICRMKYMQGYNVLHPMGFDAFGLPAENEAIKNKTHPATMIERYANNYHRQMDLVGISYDWSRTFASSDPSYYRWTQWVFEILHKRGLAYRRLAAVNWDPVDKTVLADEEIIGGRAERSGAIVEKRWIPQWFFKITDYAQRLIDDLETLDWPDGIKSQQRNWIGRSDGVQFGMKVAFMSQGDYRRSWGLPPVTLDVAPPAEEAPKLTFDEEMEQLRKEAAEGHEALPHADTSLRAVQLGYRAEKAKRDIEQGPVMDAARETYERMAAKVEMAGFEVRPSDKTPHFQVFTTRVDTVFGMTFCVLAPEHEVVDQIRARVAPEHQAAIDRYREQAKLLSDTARAATDREKTGVFTGAYAMNPANGMPVPIWIADYVLATYGTGAIMAVPGHDQRDFDFAVKFGLPVIPVIKPTPEYLRPFWKQEVPFDYEAALKDYEVNPKSYSPVFDSKDSTLINSGEYNGLTVQEAQVGLGMWMEGNGIGERKIQYKLRDWLISRQRYWGCPIPVIHSADGEEQLVPFDCLPVTLPEVENYEPAGDGSSPLAHIPEFVNTTDLDGRLGRRETDTMGGFACSSWYFLRFCDPHNEEKAWDPEKAQYWMPVDCYVGGAEHAVMHLLYARFWTKVLFDEGLVTVKEPFQRLENQGQVLALTPYRKPREGESLDVGEEGILVSFKEAKKLPEEQLIWKWSRMSKSKGNVVTPDEAVEEYGADALRMYLLFVAPFNADVQWSSEGMQGQVRFLNRIFKLAEDLKGMYDPDWSGPITFEEPDEASRQLRRLTHSLIKKAQDDIDKFAFNTYVSSLMIFVNGVNDLLTGGTPSRAFGLAASEALESLILVLAPAAPHTADELWESIGKEGFSYQAEWPKFDEKLTVSDTVKVAVQVNGKLRDTLDLPTASTNEQMEQAALAAPKVQAHVEGKTVRKVIVVPGKLVNIVAN